MNQHYVPRVYLKNFATQKGKGFFVDVYDQKADRYFNTNINRICSEIDFYTLDETSPHGPDMLVVEKLYAQAFEPMYAKSYRFLSDNKISQITKLQRVEMLIGLFQLYMRNPNWIRRAMRFHKHEIFRLSAEAKRKGAKGITYLNEDFSFREWTEETIVQDISDKVTKTFKEQHLNGIGEIGTFHEHAIIEIAIIRDDDESEFITSDNPFVMEDLIDKNNEHPLTKGKEFILPLNKKMSLRLYHDRTKSIFKIYRKYMPNGSVAMQNASIAKQSSRFLISGKAQLDRDRDFSKTFGDSTSLELKMDMLRQIVDKAVVYPDSKVLHETLKYYLSLYDKNGGLTEQEEHEMYWKVEQQKIAVIRKRV